MKSFLKYTLATIVGSIVTLLIVFFIFLGVFSSMLSSFSKPEAYVNENSVLRINLLDNIPDKASDNPFDSFNFATFESKKYLGLNDILKTIEKAKTDSRIKGIYLGLDNIEAGFATVEEIRNKLIDFKESGKFIVSYSSNYSQIGYYLASVSDKIYMNPQGGMAWKGMASQVMFYKGLLDKIGIEAQIFRHGQFKSAVEPFMNSEMSEASKLQSTTLVKSIWDDLCKNISEKRGIDIEKLNLLADSLNIFDAESALKHKMIDGLKYYDEVLAELKSESGNLDSKSDFFIDILKYSKAKSDNIVKNSSSNKIAVIFAEGDIVDGDEMQTGSIVGNPMAEIIRKAREDDDVKAVVLRVNSPGGSGLASEIIWREVKLTNDVKPVVVSMGNYAASGGYYISCPASYIFAQPNTITGSIGVFGMIPNFQQLMNNTFGITVDGVKTNANSDFGSVLRPVTKIERDLIQTQIEDFYNVFLSRVVDGRKMGKAMVDSVGQGRVWSGINALEIGLVDEIGGLGDAVKKATELAKIDDHIIREYPENGDFMMQLMKDMSMSAYSNSIKEILGENYKFFEALGKVKKLNGIQARMEYELVIY